MTAGRLLALYPRRWRERYGDEFLAMAGDGALSFFQIVDVVFGAVDARLSSDLRLLARGQHATTFMQGEAAMRTVLSRVCAHKSTRYTLRDSWISAGVLIASSLLLVALGGVLKRQGIETAGEVVTSLALPVSMLISMPFALTKGQPWKAQVALLGGMILLLIGIGILSTRI